MSPRRPYKPDARIDAYINASPERQARLCAEPHVSSMRRYHAAMVDACFAFWSAASDQLPPSWSEAKQRLRAAPARA